MRLKELLGQQNLDRIQSAVKKAETTTLGEIVPLIVRQSDRFQNAVWRISIFISTLIGITVLFLLHELWIVLTVKQTAGLLFGGALLTVGLSWIRWPFAILRWFILPAELSSAVHRSALQAFYENNLHETRGKTGVLIYISWNEHQVTLLADKGIHEKVKPGTWDEIVRQLTNEIKAGRAAEGLVQAIENCGMILTKHFPVDGDNPSELSDEVILRD